MLLVSPASSFEPPVQGFNVDDKKKGGEGVPLDSTSANGDGGATVPIVDD